MEKKNDNTILLLVAAGLGVYWLTRKKASVIDQKSTQPIIEQPILVSPVLDEPIYNAPVMDQPIYNEPINTQPIYEELIYTAPVMDQPIQNVEFTPVTDMFNTVWQPNYVEKMPDEAVFNMNIEAL
jgi:hypothetical protein